MVQHTNTLLTAGIGSTAALTTEALPEGFFQAITQLFIAAVTVWKILHDGKKDKQDKQ
jgi:hypothetical protein